jgi:LemA protein
MATVHQEQFVTVEEARVMKIALAILAILLVIGLLLGSSFVSRRNQMAIKREAVNAAWSQVDVVLQRRADLIPNLVETVKGYAAQEVTVFGDIAKARSALLSASTPADKIAANQRLDSALGRLLVVVENYPQLKSNENFLRLQDELAGTENRIAVERRRYNETLQDYNTYLSLFPNNLVASMSGFARNDAYFKADEGARQVPKVNFENQKAPAAPAQAPVPAPAKP